MVFQKYFDQWDYSLKLLGSRLLQITQINWNAAKVELMIGEEPSPLFYSRIFSKFQTIVEEGLLTPTQRNMQAQQMLDVNSVFGREVLPASMIIKDMNIQGKTEIMQFLQQQEQQASQMNQEQTAVQHAFENAKLQELTSRAASNLAMAKERYGRFESNVGLLEERISEISKNRSLSTKAKMEALEQLINVIQKYGEIETMLKMNQIQSFDYQQKAVEDTEKQQAYQEANSNEFLSKLMNSNQGMST
jgi:DNA-directed RNA polymerase beta subunit